MATKSKRREPTKGASSRTKSSNKPERARDLAQRPEGKKAKKKTARPASFAIGGAGRESGIERVGSPVAMTASATLPRLIVEETDLRVAKPSHSKPSVNPPTVSSLFWPAEHVMAAQAQGLNRPRGEILAFKSELKQRMRWSVGSGGATALSLSSPPPAGGIVGVGFGAKVTDGRIVSTECVRVYVRKKLPKSQVTHAVPSVINGLPTDVIVAPAIHAQAVECGVSVGHFKILAGTLGCVVTKGDTRYILSNNHVLANCNAAANGDEVWQPGKHDGGAAPAFARLAEFRPLDFSGAANSIDAAIAKLVDAKSVDPKLRLIGPINSHVATPKTGLPVKKCGRTTDLTSGYVEGISEDVNVGYGPFGKAFFEDQVAIRAQSGMFSRNGDSGSLIVTANDNQAFALLFAGDESKGLTFASPLAGVLKYFGVAMAV